MQLAVKSWDLFVIGDSSIWYELYNEVKDNALLMRFFSKYVKQEDVAKTHNALKNVLQNNERYLKILKGFDSQTYCSELNLKAFGEYIPVRIVIFDEPFCTISDNIQLEDYDNNDGEPFWMRPKYILEHYSKNNRK